MHADLSLYVLLLKYVLVKGDSELLLSKLMVFTSTFTMAYLKE